MTSPDLVSNRDVPRVTEMLNRSHLGVFRPPFRITFTRGDGERVELELQPLPLTLENNTYIMFRARKAPDDPVGSEEPPVSESQFRALFENALEGVYRSTPNGQIIMANPALAKILGYDSVEQMMSLDIASDLYQEPEKRKDYLELLEREGEIRNAQLVLKRRDGQIITILENSRIVRDESGKPLYYEGTLTDITDLESTRAALQEAHDHLEKRVRERTADLRLAVRNLELEVKERRAVEEKLKESERHYRDLFQNAVLGLYRTTPEGRIQMVNSALLHMLGYTYMEELLDKNLEEEEQYGSSFRRSRFKEIMEREGEIVGLNTTWKRKDGTFLQVRESARAIRDKEGNVLYYEGFVEDISATKKTEERLKLLLKAVESIELGLTISDEEGTILYTNPAEAAMHGYSSQELLGKNVRIFGPHLLHKRRQMNDQEIPRGWKRETLNVRRDGSVFPVQLASIDVWDENGKPAGNITISEDITERKRSEEILERRQKALHAVYNIATTKGHDLQGVCDQISRELVALMKASHVTIYRFTGTQLDLLSGFHVGTEVNPTLQFTNIEALINLLNKENYIQYDEKIVRISTDKSKRENKDPGNYIGIPIKDSGGRILGIVNIMGHGGIAFDEEEIHLIEIFAQYIAYEMEREQMMERLHQLKRMELLGQLTGGVAHEVRNPLNAILALTEALSMDLEEDPDQKVLLDQIRQQVERLSKLMSDLLELGKPIQKSNLIWTSLPSLCSASIDIWRESHPEEKRKIELVVPDTHPDPHIFADTSRLQQVFVNLLDNASQHSPESRPITVKILPPAMYLIHVRIIDRGNGIPPDKLSEVFDPFYTSRKGGTGLGLTIVRHIVENHGGAVSVFNNDPPPGCAIEISLPYTEEFAE